jgi:hypothetical protein
MMRDIKRQKSVELLRLMKAPSSPIHGRFQAKLAETARADCTLSICKRTMQSAENSTANHMEYRRAA